MADPIVIQAKSGAGTAPEAARAGLWPVVITGIVVVALFFGGFGAWATLAPLQSAAIAPGTVIVDTNRKTLQHLEGGIVSAILVRDGDKVVAGQVVLRLDETLARAALGQASLRHRAARALEARLVAERDGATEVGFPAWLQAERGNLKIDEMLRGQIAIFKARHDALGSQVAILDQRIFQSREEIVGIEGQIASEETQLGLIAEEAAGIGMLVEKGLAPKPRLLALLRRQAEIEGNRSQNHARIARVNQGIGEARLRMTELETARIGEVVAELRDVQTVIFDLEERIRASEDILTRTAIVAPLDGTIVDLQVHTTGGVINPGQPLMDIVPSGDRLYIDAQLDPNDIESVYPGLPAMVRLTAFSQRNTKPIEARLVRISADSLTDENSKRTYFLARIELLQDPADVLDGGMLYPGMQAEVMIVTGERTALDYLLRPLEQSLNRAFRED